MEDSTKKILGGAAAGYALGKFNQRTLAASGIRAGFWELIAPLAIFMCLVLIAISWGTAALEKDRYCYKSENKSDSVCVQKYRNK